MKKLTALFLSLGAAAFGPALAAAGGAVPHWTTFHQVTLRAPAVVRAKLLGVDNMPADTPNVDVMIYRFNNNDERVRRDARLEVIEVIRNVNNEIPLGAFTIVSESQRALHQYPASLREGREAIFCLEKGHDGRWHVGAEHRGILSEEDCGGDFQRGLDAVRFVRDLYIEFQAPRVPEGSNVHILLQDRFVPDELNAMLQDRLLQECRLDGTRLSIDAMLEFGYTYDRFAHHFDAEEKSVLLGLLEESRPGSPERDALLTAVGRVLPPGGERVIVDLIASDPAFSTASLGSWALEMYSRPLGGKLLLDKYVTLPSTETMGRARLITALGILRPRAASEAERENRSRFTDILRTTLASGGDALILHESLLAARDMRYTENELAPELLRLAEDYRTGAADEIVYKRVIVALAATRSPQARQLLLNMKGKYFGRFDKHIDLSLLTPFTVLVDYQ